MKDKPQAEPPEPEAVAPPDSPKADSPPTSEEIFSLDKPIVIDLDDISVAEQDEAEELSGLTLETLLDGRQRSKKLLQALLYISARKLFPTVTFEQAGEAKPHTYGWILEDTPEGVQIPLQALLSGSPYAWARLSRITSLENDAAEMRDSRKNGEESSQESESPTS